MTVYVDASVIVRALLADEPQWEGCADVVTGDANLLITAPWTAIECHRAVRAAWRDARLAAVDEALASVHRVIATFALVSPPHDHLVPVALRIVERHMLKTLDAMHLAAAVLAADMTEYGLDFASVDHALQAEGMSWPEP